MSKESRKNLVLFDSHCHFDGLTEKEQKETITNLVKNNVKNIVSCSTSFSSNKIHIKLKKQYKEVLVCLGIYPLDLNELTIEEREKAFNFVKENVQGAIGIGEVGMDFKFATQKEEREIQEKYFRKFIQLSNETKKPIIVHTRYAESQCMKVLEEEKAKKVLLHSFTSSEKLMQKAASNGYFVSVGLSITYNENVQKNIKNFPLENLLLETDAPMTLSNTKHYPESVKLVAQKVAEIKGIAFEEVVKQQEKNFQTLFNID